MFTLYFEDCSEDYPTYTEARTAQIELNQAGMIGSCIEES